MEGTETAKKINIEIMVSLFKRVFYGHIAAKQRPEISNQMIILMI